LGAKTVRILGPEQRAAVGGLLAVAACSSYVGWRIERQMHMSSQGAVFTHVMALIAFPLVSICVLLSVNDLILGWRLRLLEIVGQWKALHADEEPERRGCMATFCPRVCHGFCLANTHAKLTLLLLDSKSDAYYMKLVALEFVGLTIQVAHLLANGRLFSLLSVRLASVLISCGALASVVCVHMPGPYARSLRARHFAC